MSAQSLYFVEPRTVSLQSREVPDPDPEEVLVETRVSLVSAGTELLVYRGDAPDDLSADEAIDALDGDLAFPLQYGYAAVGDVIAVGGEVSSAWRGRTVFAFNPHESHFVAPPDDLVPVPDEITVETAAFLPNAETAANLALDGNPRLGERVVVLGAGVVGLLTAAVLAEFPLERLTVVDPVAARRSIAARLGADEVFDPETARDRRADRDDADIAFELTGSPDALDDAIDLVGYDGRVIVGSWYGRKRVDANLGGHFHRGRVSLISSQVSTIAPELRGRWTKSRRLDAAWDRLRRVDASEFVTHRMPFEEADRAYELLDGGPENALGVLLSYG